MTIQRSNCTTGNGVSCSVYAVFGPILYLSFGIVQKTVAIQEI